MYKSEYKSPIGTITMCSDGQFLVGLWFNGQKHFGGKIDIKNLENKELPIFQEVKTWLNRYFRKECPNINELSLKPIGSEFRKTIWKILCTIPYGQTMTYGQIAQIIAKQKGLEAMSAQAVGGAVGHNPISIIIPCHRVVGTNGKLTGYAGGLETKRFLLDLEKNK